MFLPVSASMRASLDYGAVGWLWDTLAQVLHTPCVSFTDMASRSICGACTSTVRQMGVRWMSDGCQMGVRWMPDGCQMAVRWLLGGGCCDPTEGLNLLVQRPRSIRDLNPI